MALNLEDKKALVAEVSAVAAKAHVGGGRRVPWADRRADDRAACQGARVRRVHACGQEHAGAQGRSPAPSFECIGPKLKGPLVLAFSKDDPGAAARVVKDFAKDNDKLVATLVSLGGQVLPGKELEKVASLPTREQALSMLLGVHEGTDPEVRRHARGAGRRSWCAPLPPYATRSRPRRA